MQEGGQAGQVEGGLQLGCSDLPGSIHLVQDAPLAFGEMAKVNVKESSQTLIHHQVTILDLPQAPVFLPEPVTKQLDQIWVVASHLFDFTDQLRRSIHKRPSLGLADEILCRCIGQAAQIAHRKTMKKGRCDPIPAEFIQQAKSLAGGQHKADVGVGVDGPS